MDRFAPVTIDALKNFGDDSGKFYGLPFVRNNAVLYYNKDLFDKFGVDYPEDGMSWDEVIEISRKMTRTDEGVDYSGLHAHGYMELGGQMELPFVDPEKRESLIEKNFEDWKYVFETLGKIYAHDPNKQLGSGRNREAFLKDRTLAMWPDWTNDLRSSNQL